MAASMFTAGPALSLVCLLIGILCGLFPMMVGREAVPVARMLMVGLVCAAMGLPLLLMQTPLSDALDAALGQGLVILALIGFWRAADLLHGLYRAKLVYTGPVAAWILFSCLPWFRTSIQFRSATAMSEVVVLTLLATFGFARQTHRSPAAWFLIGVSLLQIILSMMHVLAVAQLLPDEISVVPMLLPFEILLYVMIFPCVVLFKLARRILRRSEDEAYRDPLTGVFNRRGILAQSRREVERAMLLFDLDHFKRVNDIYGHAVGDRVIVAFARIAVAILGDEAVFGRIGGEEFIAILYDRDAPSVVQLADAIRADLSASQIGREFGITVSVGVALPGGSSVPFDDQLIIADTALYRAKRAGRNKVETSLTI